jgi:mannose-6-phosphate isomerase-like protein (cupin superfamily)
MMNESRYLVKANSRPAYSPNNHTGTVNRRLISPETVGSSGVEVLLGTIEPGQGALPHAHPGIEQVCYLLEGTAHVEVGGESFDMSPGDCCYFPADIMHVFLVTGKRPAKLLVIYTPPYEENPDRVIR